MIAGVSTACFYPGHTEEALRFLADNGTACVEVFLNCVSELDESYLRELRAIADGGGVKIKAIHPFTSFAEGFLFFSQYDRRFNEGMEFYRKYYIAVNILGAEILVFHGNGNHTPVEEDLYFELYGALLNDAASFGVELCHENVSYCQGGSPDFLSRLIQKHPKAGIVFDMKQAIRAGIEPAEFVTGIKNNIRHIHVSDSAGDLDCLLPGAGTFNIAGLLMDIGSFAVEAGAIVEVYRGNFGENVEIIQGYQHLWDIVSTLS